MYLELRNRLIQSLTWICILILTSMTLLVVAGIVSRYVFNNSLGWTEELARMFQVWLTFLGAPLVVLLLGHITVDLLTNALSPKNKFVLTLVVYSAITVFSAFMFYGAVLLTATTWRMKLVTLDISHALSLYLPMLISAVLMIIAAIINMIAASRESR